MQKKLYLLVALFLFSFLLSSCSLTAKEKEYYAHKENYVTAVGTVTFIHYNEEKTALYLGFSDLSPRFSDNSFKIVGKNLQIVQGNGIDEKLKIGDSVDFITAPKYFGDGYVMPIVALSINGESLLDFDEGYTNLLSWLSVSTGS